MERHHLAKRRSRRKSYDQVRDPDPTQHGLSELSAFGNRAITQFLARSSPTTQVVARDHDPLTDDEVIEKSKSIPEAVLGGAGGADIHSPARRRNLLDSGKDYFGSYDATVSHFAAIESVDVPGKPLMHKAAKGRLEAARSAVKAPVPGPVNEDGTPGAPIPGGEIPSSTTAFQFRHKLDTVQPIGSLWMHDLGFAIDYDALNLPRIGRGESAELLSIVTGAPPNAQLGAYETRRPTVSAMGKATEADPNAVPDAKGAALLTKIPEEASRLAAASKAFQGSLGSNTAVFLELRSKYFEAQDGLDQAKKNTTKAKTPDDKTSAASAVTAAVAEVDKVKAAVPPAIKPWTDAVDHAKVDLDKVVKDASPAGVDPAKIPDDSTINYGLIPVLTTIETQAGSLLKTLKGADPKKPEADKILAWETKLGLASDGSTGDRIGRIVENAKLRKQRLVALIGVKTRLARIESLKLKLADMTFLFGTPGRSKGQRPGTAAAADSPSMAQLVEKGFFRMDASSQYQINSRFLVELARHGFDLGVAWGGESEDSMHMELVVGKGGAV